MHSCTRTSTHTDEEIDRRSTSIMADVQEQEDRKKLAEEYWYPNQEEVEHEGWNPDDYFPARNWRTDDITSIPPMCCTDQISSFNHPRSSLQIVSIRIASIRGGLRWPIHVYGMVTARDVYDNHKHVVIYARARGDCQTITEEHPYLLLTGPTRAVLTCHDPGNIEIVLKVEGETESQDRDLSSLVLTLSQYCSFRGDYPSKRSTLQLGFHHIASAVEATISVRIDGGSVLPPGGLQGVFTASTASIHDTEILLLAFGDGKLPLADDGTINFSRRVVSVGYSRQDQKDQLKVSVVAKCAEGGHDATRDDIVFTPKTRGRSWGVFHVGACKMQVTVAWSQFDF